MKLVVITGCLGFMASYVTKKALDRGWFVRGVDKFTYAAREDLLEEYYKQIDNCNVYDADAI